MTDAIAPTAKALAEALSLSEEILSDIELSRDPPVAIALKARPIARLLNDFDHQRIFQYEEGGYPTSLSGFSTEVWSLLIKAGRTYQQRGIATTEIEIYAYAESIDRLAQDMYTGQLALEAARDRHVSVAFANPSQYVFTPPGNSMERQTLRTNIGVATERLSHRRAFLHDYASRRYSELKFSGVAGDTFSRIRTSVDDNIGSVVPDAVQKFSAVHDNLRSENPEDRSNAVHS